jgi:prepilin-type N-terminal cleavage/methylation domain-containing protein
VVNFGRQGPKNPTGKSECGFTLLEIMIALTIIGVLAAVATINFGKAKRHWELSTATRILVSDIRGAQWEARSYGEMVEVYFYPDWDYYERRNDAAVQEAVYLPEGVSFAYIKGFKEISVTPAVYRLRFNSSGTPGGTTGSAYLTNRGRDEYRRIIVRPVTGRVRITMEAP